jgi:hypothetical protein
MRRAWETLACGSPIPNLPMPLRVRRVPAPNASAWFITGAFIPDPSSATYISTTRHDARLWLGVCLPLCCTMTSTTLSASASKLLSISSASARSVSV